MPLIVSHVRVPSLASLYEEDARLPNTGGDYTKIGRHRLHPWTPEEKQILYVLSKFYKNGTTELWRIFLAFFDERYRRLPRPRRSAWDSMRVYNLHPARFAVWWGEATTERLKAKLEQQALKAGTRLRPVLRSDLKATNPRKKRSSHSPGSTSNSDGGWNSDDTEDADHKVLLGQITQNSHRTFQTPRSEYVKLAGGLPTPPSSQKRRVPQRPRPAWIHHPTIPPIAFRAFSSDSQGLNGSEGFVAGSFVQAPWSEAQAPTNEVEYLKDLERHLAREHNGFTPFISTSQTLLRVIQLVLRRCREAREGTSTDWKIAVINLSKVSSLARPVWKLKAGQHSRNSLGEWAVYGAITSSQVLSVLAMDELLQIMSQTTAPFQMHKVQEARNTRAARTAFTPFTQRTLTHNDGIAIGHLLSRLGIPGRYIGHVCSIILWDWKFPEERDNAWTSNEDFVQGLEDGHQQTTNEYAEVQASEDESTEVVGAEDSYCNQNSHSNGDYDDAYSAAAETPLQTDDTVMDLFADIEEAFGEQQCGHATSVSNLEDRVGNEPYDWIRPKQESSDRVILEAIPKSYNN